MAVKEEGEGEVVVVEEAEEGNPVVERGEEEDGARVVDVRFVKSRRPRERVNIQILSTRSQQLKE